MALVVFEAVQEEVEIPKAMIVERSRSGADKANQAYYERPGKIDVDNDAELLQKYDAPKGCATSSRAGLQG